MKTSLEIAAIRRHAIMLVAAAALCACHGDSATDADAPSVNVSLLASSGEVLMGETLKLTAVVRSAEDQVIPWLAPTWSTSNANIASVDQAGTVTGVRVGTATIMAEYGGSRRTRTLEVLSNDPVTIRLVAPPASVYPGSTVTLKAEVRGVHNLLISAPQVVWLSDNPGIAAVIASGRVTGVTPGVVSISATSGTATLKYSLRVRSVTAQSFDIQAPDTLLLNERVQMRAVLTATDGLPLDGATTWSVEGSAVTVSADGHVTGVAAGTAIVTATAGGFTASRAVSVWPFGSFVNTLYFGLMEDMVVGESEPIIFNGTYSPGAGPRESVVITSSDPSVATVSGPALIAVGSGTVTVTASTRRVAPITKTLRIFPRTTEAAVPAVQTFTVTHGTYQGGWTWYVPTIVMKETSGLAGYRITAIRASLVGANGTHNETMFTRVSPGATRMLWDYLSYYDDPFEIDAQDAVATAMRIELDYVDDAGNRGTVVATANIGSGTG
jgi:uncharacterized protein YjdB